MTLGTLPPLDTVRWVPKRKASLVRGLQAGLLTFDEACARYSLSADELLSWQRELARDAGRPSRITHPSPPKRQARTTPSSAAPSGKRINEPAAGCHSPVFCELLQRFRDARARPWPEMRSKAWELLGPSHRGSFLNVSRVQGGWHNLRPCNSRASDHLWLLRRRNSSATPSLWPAKSKDREASAETDGQQRH